MNSARQDKYPVAVYFIYKKIIFSWLCIMLVTNQHDYVSWLYVDLNLGVFK